MKKFMVKWISRLVIWGFGLAAALSALFLFGFIFWKGQKVMSLTFLLGEPGGLPFGTAGGIFPALVGTLMLGALSALLGGIFGILSGAYLAFAAKRGVFYLCVQGAMTALSGISSMIFGLVGYTFLIYKLGVPRSLLSAAITVSAMILPFVGIRAKKIFEEKGGELMQTSLSLGISKTYTLRKMIFPVSLSELISAVALGMAYGMGAVAPILYTGTVMQAGIPEKLTDPFMSLPYHLYYLVSNGYSQEYSYGTAFVLMAMLLCIRFICKIAAAFGNRRRRGEEKVYESTD